MKSKESMGSDMQGQHNSLLSQDTRSPKRGKKFTQAIVISAEMNETPAQTIRRFLDRGQTVQEVADFFQVTPGTIYSWKPQEEKKVKGGLQEAWDTKRDIMLTRIQSPTAQRRRRNSLIAYYQENTDAAKIRNKRISSTKSKNMDRKLRIILGEEPVERLRSLYVTRGLTPEQIAAELTNEAQVVTRNNVLYWIRRSGLVGAKEYQGLGVKATDVEIVQHAQAQKQGLIEQLSIPLWEVIALRFLSHANISFDWIAKQQGVTRQAIQLRQKKALTILQDKIQEKSNR